MDNNALKQQIEHIRHLMADGNVDAAIDELRALSKTIRDSATKDEIIAISSKFNRLERDLRNQVISMNDLNLKHNQLTNQVLSLLSSLEESYQRVTDRVGPPGPRPAPPAPSSRPAWLLPALLGLVTVLAIGGWALFGGDNDEDPCQTAVDAARSAYFADDYDRAARLLDGLGPACRNSEAVDQLTAKIAAARTPDADQPEDPPGRTPEPDPVSPDPPKEPTPAATDEQEAEDKQWCNDRYREAAAYLQRKAYDRSRDLLRQVIDRCGTNDRLRQFAGMIDAAEARDREPADRELKRFLLHFPKAYLVHSGDKTQLITGNPISYGQDWEVKKLKSFLYHVRRKSWSQFYWQVNTSREEVHLVRNGRFGNLGGDQQKEPTRVVAFPNKENPTRFQLYFAKCYLVFAPPATLQVAAEGKVLQDQADWQIKQVAPSTYHLKNDAWRTNLFWKADLAANRVERFRGTTEFGKASASSSERLDAKVETVYE